MIVHAEQTDRHFRLTVEDRGVGVPPEFVPDLFERFTRSERSRVRQPSGTGLGLAIARLVRARPRRRPRLRGCVAARRLLPADPAGAGARGAFTRR